MDENFIKLVFKHSGVRDPLQKMRKLIPESFPFQFLQMFLTYIAGVTHKEKTDFCEIFASAVHSVEFFVPH